MVKSSLFVFLLTLLFFNGCAVEQPKFQATAASTREAIARGEAKEFIGVMEARALEAQERKAWAEAASAYIQASNAATTSGQLQRAVSYASKALEIAKKRGNTAQQALAISHLVFAHRSIGQYGKAREWAEKGIETAKQIQAPLIRQVQEANFYRWIGLDFLRSGEPQKAIEYISYSVQYQEERLTYLQYLPVTNGEAIQAAKNLLAATVNALGNAYRLAGHAQEGIQAFEKGISIIKDAGLRTPIEVNLYQGLGLLYLRQKDYPRALENLKQALENAERLNYTTIIYLASSQIGNLFLQSQRPSEAIPYYKRALETIESTRSLLQSEEFRSSFLEDKRQIYAGMIVAQLRAKNPAQAFNYNERSRSRAFLDLLGGKVQLARAGALLEEERELQAKINTIQASMAGQEPDAPVRGELRKELEAAQNAYNDFLAKVRRENKEQASLMNVEPLTLKQVQELLDPGVTILEYFVVRQAAFLWVIDKERARFVRIAIPRSDLVSKVSELRDNIYQVGQGERFKQASQELYKLLIEPALPHIRGKELLIIPHDVLHHLPFQALLSGKERYLIQDYPLYYLSSASLLQFTRERRRVSREGS